MSVCIVENKNVIAPLFAGWEETMIYSCLQGVMGIAYADNPTAPLSAQISIGDFCFFVGKVNEELLRNRPINLQSDCAIFVPENEAWAKMIEQLYKDKAIKQTRYATKKQKDVFNKNKLQNMIDALLTPYELKSIDCDLYKKIRELEWARDLCNNYANCEEYARIGLGFVITKQGEIVAGASSYTSFQNGIEIEIDTREDERRKGLATVCGAKLILACLERGWYPSWDAHNKGSLLLAEKLGYCFDKEYPVYEVAL